jgi:cytochrome P450
MPLQRLFFVVSATAIILHDRLRLDSFRGVLPLLKASLVLTFLIWTSCLLYYWMIYPRFTSPLRHLPNPTGGSCFMGHFFKFLDTGAGKQCQRWVNEIPNDGLIRYLDIFNSERILPTSPQALADVLVNHSYDFEKPAILRKGFSRILGLGLFLAEGKEHKWQRKTMMPAFHFRHVKNLYGTFWEKSLELVEEVSGYSDGESYNDARGIEVKAWASRATLDIIGLAGMGQDFGSLQNEDNPLNITYLRLFKPSRIGQIIAILNTFLPAWLVKTLPLQRNDDIKNASDTIKKTCFDLIQQKKTAMEKGNTEKDILSVALESGGFSDEDLVNQMMTFLAAGHETTASALNRAVYTLCKYPSIQRKLRAEVHSRLDPHLTTALPISSDLIDNSPYLQAFCQEILRLYPPVSATGREAVVDTTIANTPIPKGTTIIISLLAINTSTALWGDDAQEFRPERWLGDESRNNFSFLTFLHGPRSCIGQKFAVAEFACLVAAWVSSFETRLVDPEKEMGIRSGITLKPSDELWVRVKRIQ